MMGRWLGVSRGMWLGGIRGRRLGGVRGRWLGQGEVLEWNDGKVAG